MRCTDLHTDTDIMSLDFCTNLYTDHNAEPDIVREKAENIIDAEADAGDNDGHHPGNDQNNTGDCGLTVLVSRVDWSV